MKRIFLGGLFVLISSIFLLDSANPQPQISDNLANILQDKNPKLATVVNGRSIDDDYIRNYLQVYDYFSGINYDIIPSNQSAELVLTAGNKEDNIKGLEIDGQNYVIHLISCSRSEPECAFRINGVATGAVESADKAPSLPKTKFGITEAYELVLNSITYDFCYNKRFCNLNYEAYDIINISVIPK